MQRHSKPVETKAPEMNEVETSAPRRGARAKVLNFGERAPALFFNALKLPALREGLEFAKGLPFYWLGNLLVKQPPGAERGAVPPYAVSKMPRIRPHFVRPKTIQKCNPGGCLLDRTMTSGNNLCWWGDFVSTECAQLCVGVCNL